MDPDSTLAILRDPANDLLDRVDSAIDLARWLSGGGFMPAAMTDEQRNLLFAFVGELPMGLDRI